MAAIGDRGDTLARFINETSSIKRASPNFLPARGCSSRGHRMKTFHLNFIAFLFTPAMAICALAPAVVAQPPAISPQPQAELKKAPTPPRAKPQVIYRVPKADVAALHAQAKSQTDALAVDSNMPTSLQMSRNAANEAAANAATSPQPSASPNLPIEKTDSVKNLPRHSRVRAKESPRSKNFSPRVQGKGPQKNSHAPKSHKK